MRGSIVSKFSIEMDDRDSSKYCVVHATGCKDLRDPEPLGDDWREGVVNLGSWQQEDVDDNAVPLAPCARAIDK